MEPQRSQSNCIFTTQFNADLKLFNNFCERKEVQFNLIRPDEIHKPTSSEIETLIDSLTYQLAWSESLYKIPDTITKESKTLQKIKKITYEFVTSDTPCKTSFRNNFTRLYKKVHQSSTAVEYLKKHGLLNEIKGVYYLGKICRRLQKSNNLTDKHLALAAKVLYEENVNLFNSAALENLQHYLKIHGYPQSQSRSLATTFKASTYAGNS